MFSLLAMPALVLPSAGDFKDKNGLHGEVRFLYLKRMEFA
jgi:hypothetical protein